MIGDAIELTIVDIRGDKVRIGIEAPPDVPVHRKEVYEAIRRENEQAVGFDDRALGALTPVCDDDPGARPSKLHGTATHVRRETA
jgi:carbon storage regulator